LTDQYPPIPMVVVSMQPMNKAYQCSAVISKMLHYHEAHKLNMDCKFNDELNRQQSRHDFFFTYLTYQHALLAVFIRKLQCTSTHVTDSDYCAATKS